MKLLLMALIMAHFAALWIAPRVPEKVAVSLSLFCFVVSALCLGLDIILAP